MTLWEFVVALTVMGSVGVRVSEHGQSPSEVAWLVSAKGMGQSGQGLQGICADETGFV